MANPQPMQPLPPGFFENIESCFIFGTYINRRGGRIAACLDCNAIVPANKTSLSAHVEQFHTQVINGRNQINTTTLYRVKGESEIKTEVAYDQLGGTFDTLPTISSAGFFQRLQFLDQLHLQHQGRITRLELQVLQQQGRIDQLERQVQLLLQQQAVQQQVPQQMYLAPPGQQGMQQQPQVVQQQVPQQIQLAPPAQQGMQQQPQVVQQKRPGAKR